MISRLDSGLFATRFLVNEDLCDRILDRGGWLRPRKREDERLRRCANVEDLLPIVVPDRANFQSSPSDSSSAINFRIRRVAAPFIAVLLARSHFTTSFSSRYTWNWRGDGRLSGGHV